MSQRRRRNGKSWSQVKARKGNLTQQQNLRGKREENEQEMKMVQRQPRLMPRKLCLKDETFGNFGS